MRSLARKLVATAFAIAAAPRAVSSVAVTSMMFAVGSTLEATLSLSVFAVSSFSLPAARRRLARVVNSVLIVARRRSSAWASPLIGSAPP